MVEVKMRLEEVFLGAMMKHPNKHIHQAVRYAQARGWTIVKAGPRGHLWGTLRCPYRERSGCLVRVMSTPRHPESHVRDIRRAVDRCPHGTTEAGER